MILQLFKKTKNLDFQRSYRAPVETVWRAWTQPEMLRQWWGPEKTLVPQCDIDLSVGGRLYIVMEAGAAMGKYQGTRWPMEGTFTRIEENSRLTYDARSWTEGEEEGSTIHHTNDATLIQRDEMTTVHLHIAVSKIGPKARMAAFGMKWGYKQQLDKLESYLSQQS
ncbi:SRPBCC domain-containing protein [Mycolicibacterium hippocampi]|uniref:SRPBCC family protein n=1 Tax=Mycolicibacterium hippocampi TaxID=659824 RepID=UPI00351887DF